MRAKLTDKKIKGIAISENAKNEVFIFNLSWLLKILAISLPHRKKTFDFYTILQIYAYVIIKIYSSILWKPQRYYQGLHLKETLLVDK